MREFSAQHGEERFLNLDVQLWQRSIFTERRYDVREQAQDLARAVLEVVVGGVILQWIPFAEDLCDTLESSVDKLLQDCHDVRTIPPI